jgi:hypothetical protein
MPRRALGESSRTPVGDFYPICKRFARKEGLWAIAKALWNIPGAFPPTREDYPPIILDKPLKLGPIQTTPKRARSLLNQLEGEGNHGHLIGVAGF